MTPCCCAAHLGAAAVALRLPVPITIDPHERLVPPLATGRRRLLTPAVQSPDGRRDDARESRKRGEEHPDPMVEQIPTERRHVHRLVPRQRVITELKDQAAHGVEEGLYDNEDRPENVNAEGIPTGICFGRRGHHLAGR